jgi:hypothetical protein
MSEQKQEAVRPPTRGAGPKVDVHRAVKRVKAMYRAAVFVPNAGFNPEEESGPNNPRRLRKADAPTLKEFLVSHKDDDDVQQYVESKALCRESGTAARKRLKMPPKPPNIKKAKAPKDKSGKKGGKKAA